MCVCVCVCVYIYAIVKATCLPGYHHSGFVATHALGHMMYGYTLLLPMNCYYIYFILYIYYI